MLGLETRPFELLEDGKMLFPSWDKAIEYIDKYIHRNFRLVRLENGKAELTIL